MAHGVAELRVNRGGRDRPQASQRKVCHPAPTERAKSCDRPPLPLGAALVRSGDVRRSFKCTPGSSSVPGRSAAALPHKLHPDRHDGRTGSTFQGRGRRKPHCPGNRGPTAPHLPRKGPRGGTAHDELRPEMVSVPQRVPPKAHNGGMTSPWYLGQGNESTALAGCALRCAPTCATARSTPPNTLGDAHLQRRAR